MARARTDVPVFKVVDAMDHPHGGRILRLQLKSGDPPGVRALKGGRLKATAPDGTETTVLVRGFAALGGKPSDERLARTGRADLHVTTEDGDGDGGEAPPVSLGWKVSGPV